MGGRGSSSGIGANASGARDEAYYQAKIDAISQKCDNIRKYSDDEKKDFFFQVGSVPMHHKTYYSSLSPEVADNALVESEKRYEYLNTYMGIVINENMPELEGTEKQVAYAKSLRQEALTRLAKDAVAPFDSSYANLNRNKERLDIVRNHRGYDYKTVNDAVTAELKSNLVYKFYSTETSAAKIIDDYKQRVVEEGGKTFRKQMWRIKK